MKKYILVDINNLFSRAKFSVRASNPWDAIGMTLHITISSIKLLAKTFDTRNVIIIGERKSWRKDFDPTYKSNRTQTFNKKSDDEKDLEKAYFAALEEFLVFIDEKTNMPILRCDGMEGDDLIAFWVQSHPDDHHIIVSTDQDFRQLLSPINPTVWQFDGINNHIIKPDGFFDLKGKVVIDKKTKQPKVVENPEFFLFNKIIRGDIGDGVRSSYPGVRTNGSKNKIGIMEAYNNRQEKGWAWTNFFNQKWKDENGVEHIVKEEYEKNRILIDLSAQPEYIKNKGMEFIQQSKVPKTNKNVEIAFQRFAKQYELVDFEKNSREIVSLLAYSPFKET